MIDQWKQGLSRFFRAATCPTAFPDLPLETPDYECAAEFFNLSGRRGVHGSNTDFLICAVSHRYEMPILTTDGDFRRFSEYLPIELHAPRSEVRT